jgi:hypothetical protein
MFYPAWLRKKLEKLFLCNTDDVSILVEHHTAAAGSALVKSENKLCWHESFINNFQR